MTMLKKLSPLAAHPRRPKVPQLGHDQCIRAEIPLLLFVRTHTQFVIKIFEIDVVIEI